MPECTLPSGQKMPALALGTWKAAPGVVGAAVKEAIKIGYRHIDCAKVYDNEAEVGAALKECFDSGLVKREELFVCSKLWCSSYAPEDVKPALEQQLKDLCLDYLDLYIFHWPVAKTKDNKGFLTLEESPLSKTFQAMKKCVDEGLVKNIGVSNCSTKKMDDIIKESGLTPAVNQCERHVYLQQPDLLKYCRDKGIVFVAYSPLGSGDRPAGLKKEDEPVPLEDPKILEIAKKHGASPGQILLAWNIQSGDGAAAKSTNPERLAQNLACVDYTLTEEEMKEIAALNRNVRLLDGHFFCKEGSPYTLENLWDGEKS